MNIRTLTFSALILCIIGVSLVSATNPVKMPAYIDHVEVVELNHFYDEYGKLVFDQLLFLDKYPGQTSLIVRQWYLVKNGRKVYSEEDKLLNNAKAIREYVKEHKISKEDAAEIRADLWLPEWVGDPKFQKWSDKDGKKYFRIEEDNGIRIVYYKHDSETFTQFDPELVNRELVEKEKRIPFKEIKKLDKPFVIDIPANDNNNNLEDVGP